MNKMLKLLGLLILTLALPFGALARESVPIIDHKDVLVSTPSGKPATADQVRDAIIAAANFKRWVVTKNQNQDVLTATLYVQGKHSIAVLIPYAADKFSIVYLNSTNMNYRLSDPTPMEGSMDLTKVNAPTAANAAPTPLIHPRYNRWVQDLLQAVQAELRKL